MPMLNLGVDSGDFRSNANVPLSSFHLVQDSGLYDFKIYYADIITRKDQRQSLKLQGLATHVSDPDYKGEMTTFLRLPVPGENGPDDRMCWDLFFCAGLAQFNDQGRLSCGPIETKEVQGQFGTRTIIPALQGKEVSVVVRSVEREDGKGYFINPVQFFTKDHLSLREVADNLPAADYKSLAWQRVGIALGVRATRPQSGNNGWGNNQAGVGQGDYGQGGYGQNQGWGAPASQQGAQPGVQQQAHPGAYGGYGQPQGGYGQEPQGGYGQPASSGAYNSPAPQAAYGQPYPPHANEQAHTGAYGGYGQPQAQVNNHPWGAPVQQQVAPQQPAPAMQPGAYGQGQQAVTGQALRYQDATMSDHGNAAPMTQAQPAPAPVPTAGGQPQAPLPADSDTPF